MPLNFATIFVNDWLGRGIGGINVTIIDHTTRYMLTGTTDQDGYVTFQVGLGVYDIQATINGETVEASVYYDGKEGTISLQLTAQKMVADFLGSQPFFLPNWAWIMLLSMVVYVSVKWVDSKLHLLERLRNRRPHI